MQQKKGIGGIIHPLLIIAAFACLLVIILRPTFQQMWEKKQIAKQTQLTYLHAIELFKQGEYSAADTEFGKLDYNYSHVKEYRTLCDAHRYYDKGDMVMAQFVLGWYSFNFLSQEEKEELAAFQKKVDSGYAAYMAQEARDDRQRMEERIRTEPSFYGMPESRISDTILGRYSEKKVTAIDRDREAHVYYWYKGDKILFYATCEDGTVVRVGDYRDHPRSRTDGGTDVSSYPDVSGFSNPEDFYDFYSEDFADYYEAEDFYYEHGGK